VAQTVANLREATIAELVRAHIPEGSLEEQWDVAGLQKVLESDWQINLPLTQMLEQEPDLGEEALLERVQAQARQAYQAKVDLVGQENWAAFERSVLLQGIDTHWRTHLSMLDHLRQGIHLRGYAQKDPKQEYKREAFELFSGMLDRIRTEVTRLLMTVRIQTAEQVRPAVQEPAPPGHVRYHHADYDAALSGQDPGQDPGLGRPAAAGHLLAVPKVGRNDPCPCGSGKKYKHCHGRLA